MELDLETGLPELPEGYFWRIGKCWTESSSSLHRTDNGELMLYICKPVLKRSGWFSSRVVPQVVVSKIMAEYKTVDHDKWKDSLDSKKDWHFSTIMFSGTEYVSVPEYTTETVLMYAHKLLVEFEEVLDKLAKEAAARVTAEKLIGDYPPKKLDS